MFQMIEKVSVLANDSSADKVIAKLGEMAIEGVQIDLDSLSIENSQPLIVCGSDEEVQQALHLAPKNSRTLLVWQNENPEMGDLWISHLEQEKKFSHSLIFDEAVFALLQFHMQNQRHISAETMALTSNMIGRSSEFSETLTLTKKIAAIDCDVLIRGETGTGKELIARFIHYQSERQDNPFVPINCGAFSDDLLLSELFGHTKGAFTGADSARVGLIEQAQNGTLFLDEIDSLSSKAQVALLRYLQDREVRPQGGNRLRKCDARVLAASNKSLSQLVKQGSFREDLLFRLDVLHIDLPPLRERGDDIHLLTQHFIRQAATKYKLPTKVFSPNMLQTLTKYEWPGNIRQLQNIVFRLYLLSDNFVIRTDFASKLAGVNWREYLDHERLSGKLGGMQNEKKLIVERFEKSYIREMLSKSSGNISKAARVARKERSSFIRLMKKHNIKRSEFVSET